MTRGWVAGAAGLLGTAGSNDLANHSYSVIELDRGVRLPIDPVVARGPHRSKHTGGVSRSQSSHIVCTLRYAIQRARYVAGG
jgi:hypothetical protein